MEAAQASVRPSRGPSPLTPGGQTFLLNANRVRGVLPAHSFDYESAKVRQSVRPTRVGPSGPPKDVLREAALMASAGAVRPRGGCAKRERNERASLGARTQRTGGGFTPSGEGYQYWAKEALSVRKNRWAPGTWDVHRRKLALIHREVVAPMARARSITSENPRLWSVGDMEAILRALKARGWETSTMCKARESLDALLKTAANPVLDRMD